MATEPAAAEAKPVARLSVVKEPAPAATGEQPAADPSQDAERPERRADREPRERGGGDDPSGWDRPARRDRQTSEDSWQASEDAWQQESYAPREDGRQRTRSDSHTDFLRGPSDPHGSG